MSCDCSHMYAALDVLYICDTLDVFQANLSLETIYHLENLSLVDFSSGAAIARLASAIRYADRLKDVDVSGVEPLFSLLENECVSNCDVLGGRNVQPIMVHSCVGLWLYGRTK